MTATAAAPSGGNPLQVAIAPFAPLDYAFAVPDDRPSRETLNRALLRAVSQPVWPQILFRYLEE